jgi:hypothetical protein
MAGASGDAGKGSKRGTDARVAFNARSQAWHSPLAKQYGWGIDYDADGRVAIYGVDTRAYRDFLGRADLQIRKELPPPRLGALVGLLLIRPEAGLLMRRCVPSSSARAST